MSGDIKIPMSHLRSLNPSQRAEFSRMGNELLKVKEFQEFIEPKRVDFESVEHFFREDGRKRLSDELVRKGITLDDVDFVVLGNLRYQLTGDVKDRIGKSSRVVNAIDVKRKGGNDTVCSMYVKYINTPQEVKTIKAASDRGWMAPTYHIEDMALFSSDEKQIGGYLTEFRCPKGTSIRNVGGARYFRQELTTLVALRLGKMMSDMLDHGYTFDFAGAGHTNTRILGKGNEDQPFWLVDPERNRSVPATTVSNLIRALRTSSNAVIEHHLSGGNDFAAWAESSLGDAQMARQLRNIRYEKGREDDAMHNLISILGQNTNDVRLIGIERFIPLGDKRDNEVVDQLFGVGMNVFGNVPHRYLPLAWKTFRDNFIGSKKGPFGDFLSHNVARREKVGLIDLAEQRLSSGTAYSAELWNDVFTAVSEKRDMFSWTTPGQEDLARVMGQISSAGIDDMGARCISPEVFRIAGDRNVSPRDIEVLKAGDSITIRDTQRRNLAAYTDRTGIPDREKRVLETAANHDVAPRNLNVAEPGRIICQKHNPANMLDFHDPETTKRFSEGLARTLSASFHAGILPYSVRMPDLEVEEKGGGLKVYLTNWKDNHSKEQHPDWTSLAGAQKERVIGEIEGRWDDTMVDFLTEHADLIKKNSNAPIAWKAFSTVFRHLGITDEENNRNRVIMDRVESGLWEDPQWRGFMAESQRATLEKREFRLVQRSWLDEMRSRDPLTHYHTDTRKELRRLDPAINHGISRVFRERPTDFEDVVADVRHVHIFVAGDRSTLIDAKAGNLKIDAGLMMFELYEMGRGRARTLKNQFLVPFRKDGENYELGETQTFNDESSLARATEGYVSPAAFKVHLRSESHGGYEVGGNRFSLQWNDNLFTDQDPDINALRRISHGLPISSLAEKEREEAVPHIANLDKQTRVEDIWEHSLNVIVEEFADWFGVIKGLYEFRDSLPEGQRENFMMGSRRSGIKCGMSECIDPYSPLLFDGNEGEEYTGFEIYRALPDEVLKKKVAVAYGGHLDESISELLTSEQSLELMRGEINKLKKLPAAEDLERMSRERALEEVRLSSTDPMKYIKKAEYVKDGGHYVVRLIVNVSDGSERSVILKQTNSYDDTALTNFAVATGYPTPISVPLTDDIVLQTEMPGKRLNEARETISGNEEKLASTISGLTGLRDMSGRNGLIRENGEIILIDFDPPPLARTPGMLGIISEWATLEDCAPGMETPEGRARILGAIRGGLEAFEAKMRDPQIRDLAFSKLNHARVREGSTLTPDYLREYKRRALMPASERMKELLFWRARTEEEKAAEYSGGSRHVPIFDFNPMFHLGYVDQVMRDADPQVERLDIADILKRKDAVPYVLGMYARLAGVTGFEGDTVRYVHASEDDQSPRNRQFYAAGRLLSITEDYGDSVGVGIQNMAREGLDTSKIMSEAQKDLSEAVEKYFKPGIGVNYPPLMTAGPHDTAKGFMNPKWGTLDQRIEIARDIVRLRDLSLGRIQVRADDEQVEKYADVTDKHSRRSAFFEGYGMMGEWVRGNSGSLKTIFGSGVIEALDEDGPQLRERLEGWCFNDEGMGGMDFTDKVITCAVSEPLHQFDNVMMDNMASSLRREGVGINIYASRYDDIIRQSSRLKTGVEVVFEALGDSNMSPREKDPAYPALIDVLSEARKDPKLFQSTVALLKKEAQKPDNDGEIKDDDIPGEYRYFMGKKPGEKYRSKMDSLISRVWILKAAADAERLSEEVL